MFYPHNGNIMFFFLLLFLPILEVFGFILVSHLIGWSDTLLLTLATTCIGFAFLRYNRMMYLNDFLSALYQRSPNRPSPERQLLSGLAGILLILPGFLTDIIGILLIVPGGRSLIFHFIKKYMSFHTYSSQQTTDPFRFFRFSSRPDPQNGFEYDNDFQTDNSSPTYSQANQSSDDIIDVDFEIKK